MWKGYYNQQVKYRDQYKKNSFISKHAEWLAKTIAISIFSYIVHRIWR